MSEQTDRYIPGVPCWVDVTQPDVEAAVKFYGDLFGWKLENGLPPEAPGSYFVATINGGQVGAVGSLPEGAPAMASWNSYVWVENADASAAKAAEAGGEIVAEPFDVGDAGRMAVIRDPEGAVLSLWQGRRNRGADVVNEHGSVNFNVLNTRDPKAAEPFYAAVFGWDLLDIGGAWMWALAGYGDFLEARSPGMRKNMAEMGAPERFEDAVAGITVIEQGDTDTPAHWGVTFAADDADAIAARAAELGGTVLAPPMDVPWTRITVISDPQGAVFTASQFKPENR
jgi:predicted enzyme related to lactoylglutathione lyase